MCRSNYFLVLISFLIVFFLVDIIVTQNVNTRAKVRSSKGKGTVFDNSYFGKSDFVVCDNKTRQRLDTFAHKLVSHRFPTNGRELRQFCNAGIKGASFVLGFAKHCLTEFAQKAIQVVFHPVTNEISLICKSGRMSNKAKELLKAAECGNAARPGLRKCYQKFIDKELAIHEFKDNKRKIPMLCCEFNVLRECFKTEAEEVKICTKRTIDFVERYALEMFGEILNLMCYEYQDSSDRCTKVIKEIPPIKVDGVKRPKSFVPPMLTILQDLGD